MLGTVLVMLFGLSDYLTLGLGAAFYLCIALRLVVLAGGVATVWASGSDRSLARNARVLMFLVPSVLFMLTAILDRGMAVGLPGFIVLTLCYYMFVPLPVPWVAAASLYGGAGFLVTSILFLEPSAALVWTGFIELLLCSVLGGYTAIRTQAMMRSRWLVVRELERRVKFEDLVARQSMRFITLPLDQFDAGIDAALAEIGDFAGADRSYVFEFDRERATTSCTHEWCRDGITPGMMQIQQAPHAAFPWSIAQILNRKPIAASDLSELPPEAAPERAAAEQHAVRSLLVLPLVYGGNVLGSVGFHAIRRKQDWDAGHEGLLHQVGALIAGAIVRKRLETDVRLHGEALEMSVSALERSNSDLQKFAYAASHDLKEPLRTISSFSGLLASRYAGRLDDKADEYIHFLTSAAARMHRLITDLLEYSRIGQQVRPASLCDTHEIASQAIDNLGAAIAESGADIRLGQLPTVYGNPSQLQQLFQNLIGNALKFRNGRAPHVVLEACRRPAHWEFSVSDDGIGVDPAQAARIFEPFTRLHSAEEFPGTGIGLAMCKRIVEHHKGRIWVRPNQPKGSDFRFTLAAAS